MSEIAPVNPPAFPKLGLYIIAAVTKKITAESPDGELRFDAFPVVALDTNSKADFQAAYTPEPGTSLEYFNAVPVPDNLALPTKAVQNFISNTTARIENITDTIRRIFLCKRAGVEASEKDVAQTVFGTDTVELMTADEAGQSLAAILELPANTYSIIGDKTEFTIVVDFKSVSTLKEKLGPNPIFNGYLVSVAPRLYSGDAPVVTGEILDGAGTPVQITEPPFVPIDLSAKVNLAADPAITT